MRKHLGFWWNVIVLESYTYKHYIRKDFKTGNGYTSYGDGYEIINSLTNKVILRKGKHTNELDESNCRWNNINKYFPQNI